MAEPGLLPVGVTVTPCTSHHCSSALTGSFMIADLLSVLEDNSFSAASYDMILVMVVVGKYDSSNRSTYILLMAPEGT